MPLRAWRTLIITLFISIISLILTFFFRFPLFVLTVPGDLLQLWLLQFVPSRHITVLWFSVNQKNLLCLVPPVRFNQSNRAYFAIPLLLYSLVISSTTFPAQVLALSSMVYSLLQLMLFPLCSCFRAGSSPGHLFVMAFGSWLLYFSRMPPGFGNLLAVFFWVVICLLDCNCLSWRDQAESWLCTNSAKDNCFCLPPWVNRKN